MKSKFPISQTSSLVPTKHKKKQIKSETRDVVENYSKRRLLRNIAVTTPVVLAVSSKPALAMEDGCGSILMSGNLSTPQKILDCTAAEAEDLTFTGTSISTPTPTPTLASTSTRKRTRTPRRKPTSSERKSKK